MRNPDLNRLKPYPFEQLAALLADARPPKDLRAIPLSIGEPQHPPPEFVLSALKKHLNLIAKYPTTKGTSELRAAAAAWATTRFALECHPLDSETNLLPVNGTREAIFAAVQATCDRSKGGTVIMPNPFYQIYEGAALMAGLEPHYLPIDSNGQPDYRGVSDSDWANCQFCFICTPGNPTGTTLNQDILIELIKKANEFNFWLASDECYSEIYRDEPPCGLLQAAIASGQTDYKHCIVFHSLSKRSNLPGLRSGFVAGDASFISDFLKFRTYHGCSMSMAVQAASQLAWRDEEHVCANRVLYAEKFKEANVVLGDILDVRDPGAGFYLWIKTPTACDIFSRDLYEKTGVTVLPGQYLGREINGLNPGAGFVRIALVAEPKIFREALERIRAFVMSRPWD
ncbi:succinyldiaminopimelate transaminase [Litorivicinus sp.]|jgi:N-succinyldiaminopimelate aminotransferase|nr:succinyldiaminopimelate transaminase [Litorivicinus sp.]|tara:strand:+ start:42080 stop:43276 length:1197 start_codon:yes stop_codon:yes gene_type:complete